MKPKTSLPLFAAACKVSAEIDDYKNLLESKREMIDSLNADTERPVSDLAADIQKLEAEAEILESRIDLLTPRLEAAWLPARKEVRDAIETFVDPLYALVERGTTAFFSLVDHLAPDWTDPGNLLVFAKGRRFAEEASEECLRWNRTLLETRPVADIICSTKLAVEYLGGLPDVLQEAEQGIKKLEEVQKAIQKIFPLPPSEEEEKSPAPEPATANAA
jgi:hypothetical protein